MQNHCSRSHGQDVSGNSNTLKSTTAYHQSISLPSGALMNKSASIPISNSIRRTSSEHQLSQDEAVADYKDFLFYSRVVDRISRQQGQWKDGYLRYENQMCLAHIVRTRHADAQKKSFDDDWSQELANFGLVDHCHYHDPAHVNEETTEDSEMFVLDL